MPLMTGVVPEALRPRLLEKLEECIRVKRKGHLDTGMLGTYFLIQYLQEIGRNDLLFEIVNQKTYPGWGFMLEQRSDHLVGAVERSLVANPFLLHLARRLVLSGARRHPTGSIRTRLRENHHQARNRRRSHLGEMPSRFHARPHRQQLAA
jgi:hypothetical protein